MLGKISCHAGRGATRQHHDVPLKEASLASRLCWSDLTIVLNALGNPIPFLYLLCLFLLISWTVDIETCSIGSIIVSSYHTTFPTRLDQFHWLGITRQNSRASNGAFERHAFRRLVAVTDDDAFDAAAAATTTERQADEDVAPCRRHRGSSASANLSKLGQDRWYNLEGTNSTTNATECPFITSFIFANSDKEEKDGFSSVRNSSVRCDDEYLQWIPNTKQQQPSDKAKDNRAPVGKRWQRRDYFIKQIV